MKSRDSILRNTGYLALAEAAKPVLSFLLIIIISRMLGRAGIGGYTIILTFTALFELIGTVGLGPIITRDIAADRTRLAEYFNGAVGVALAASAVLVPVMLLILRAFNYPAEIAQAIRLLSWTMFPAVLLQCILSVCEGLQNMRLRAVISILDTLGRLAAGVFMILQGHGVLGAIQGIVFTRVVAAVLALVLVARYTPLRFDGRLMMRSCAPLVRGGLPFLVMTVTSTVFWSVNTLMLSKAARVEEVGVYNAACRITDILKNILYSYLIALLPMMSASFVRSIDDLRKECNASLRYLAITSLPVGTGVSVLAPRIIRMVYGHSFDPAVPVLQTLIWTVCVFSIALVFARVLVASHNQMLDLYCNIGALAVNVVLGWLLIHFRGPTGAAIATLVSLTAFGLMEYYCVAKRLFKAELAAPVLRAVAGSLVMAIVVRRLNSLSLPLVIAIGAATYVGALACLRTFSREEVRTARELVTGWRSGLRLRGRNSAVAILAESQD